MVFPYITGKNFAFRILVELAAVFWLGLITLSNEHRPKNSIMLLAVLIFTFIVGLADLLGINPYNSFWSNYERMEGYITILHLALYFLIIKSILKTKKDWMIFFNIFLIASILVSIYALFQKFNIVSWVKEYEASAGRVYSTIGSPPFLASYLLFTIFLGLILIINTQKLYLKYCYIFFIILNFLVIYYTRTRGAILAIITGITFVGLFYAFGKVKTPKERFIKKIALPAIGAFIILSILFWPVRYTDIHKDKPFSRFVSMLEDPSAQSRLETWKTAWAGIKERPILGWGQENFTGIYTVVPVSSPFSRFFPFTFSEPLWTDRAHNIILDWLINAGFIGLFSYLAIFFSAFYFTRVALHKNLITKTEGFTIITAIVVYFTQNLFIFDTINTYIIFFTLLAYIDNLDYTNTNEASPVTVSNNLRIKQYARITLFALLIFSFAAYFMNYKPIKEAQISNRISSYYSEYDSFLTLLVDFKKALSFKTFGDNDIRIRMAIIAERILKYKLFKDKGTLIFLQSSTVELEKLVASNSHNLSYWLYLIDIYNRIAFYEPSFISKTENLINKFIHLNPKNQWMVYFIQADNFVLKKDYENAYLTIKKAVELAPQKDTVQLRLALAGILTSREDVVNSALDNVKKIRVAKNPDIAEGKTPVFSVDELQLLTQTSMDVKSFKRSMEFLKEIIFISPDEAKYHFDIAKVYLALGDKTNAIKEAKKAAELDPLNYTHEANKFLAR
ncbi:MAG: O-antigen ligase family protein [Thermodesulfovibrionia bacterium]|nr:O-antigen ligase family protein [Thermodesulfovibrionia bacterium]